MPSPSPVDPAFDDPIAPAAPQSLGDAVLVTNSRGQVTLLNLAAESLTRWTSAEAFGQDARTIFDIRDAETRLLVESPVEQALQEGVIVSLASPAILRRRDRSEVLIHGSSVPVRDEEDRLIGSVSVFRDIFEARPAAESQHQAILDALKIREERYRTLIDSIDEGFCLVEMRFDEQDRPCDYLFLETNPAFEHHTGLRSAVGKTIRELAPDIDPSWFRIYGNVARTGQPVRFQNHDPALARWFDVYAQRVGRAEDGQVGIFFTDITERVQREQREHFLAELTQETYGLTDPEAVIAHVVRRIGAFLKVDRCLFAQIDMAADLAIIHNEYRSSDSVQNIIGTLPFSAFGAHVVSECEAGRTVAVDDVRSDPVRVPPDTLGAYLSIGVAAHIAVPAIYGGALIGVLAVHSGAPRHWRDEDVDLLKTTVERMWLTVENARLSRETKLRMERERNIAQQLQEALVPPKPHDLPGMRLSSFYRPALDEAGVGGDFFDVFDVESGCTALVVADLSGKGLAAAQQVATVRNMLRFALYQSRTLVQAITDLHTALVEHDLLTGFATLFVGLYDHNLRTLAYINCGQEAGLIWRAATGDMEQLVPTGPVLGGFLGNGFTDATVTLDPGDVIALFTDGLTEVGPSRKTLLQVEGVADLLRAYCGNRANQDGEMRDPRDLVDYLIAGVDTFAGGGRRDDIALLVGIVSDAERTKA